LVDVKEDWQIIHRVWSATGIDRAQRAPVMPISLLPCRPTNDESTSRPTQAEHSKRFTQSMTVIAAP
jgi:hypothetical protein